MILTAVVLSAVFSGSVVYPTIEITTKSFEFTLQNMYVFRLFHLHRLQDKTFAQIHNPNYIGADSSN